MANAVCARLAGGGLTATRQAETHMPPADQGHGELTNPDEGSRSVAEVVVSQTIQAQGNEDRKYRLCVCARSNKPMATICAGCIPPHN